MGLHAYAKDSLDNAVIDPDWDLGISTNLRFPTSMLGSDADIAKTNNSHNCVTKASLLITQSF